MNILLPTNEEFVEQIARAIGRERLYRDASSLLSTSLGISLSDSAVLDERFDAEFERLWAGKDEECIWERENYIEDAVAAINKINLLLLTMV